jgi:hypothetical protein
MNGNAANGHPQQGAGRGPLQVLVYRLAASDVETGIVDRLAMLEERGAVRALDVAVVTREGEDAFTTEDLALPGDRPSMGTLVPVVLGLEAPEGAQDDTDRAGFGPTDGLAEIDDEIDDDGLLDLTDDLEPGESALVLVLELTWLADLSGAVETAGGELLAEGLIPEGSPDL